MNIEFYKYHGAGNDFVIIDNRKNIFNADDKETAFLCDRHYGIGADGLMLLENHESLDFTMRYFNSDGHEATMCGNGGRCIVAFANHLGIIKNQTRFMASDGLHIAEISINNDQYKVRLQMQDVSLNEYSNKPYFLDTGSPHHINIINNTDDAEVEKIGAKIRYSDEYQSIGGTNVNFVQIVDHNKIKIRTYERGVECETLACGTGSVAAAIHYGISKKLLKSTVQVEALGGNLEVSYEILSNFARNVFLTGPAKMVFKGQLKL